MAEAHTGHNEALPLAMSRVIADFGGQERGTEGYLSTVRQVDVDGEVWRLYPMAVLQQSPPDERILQRAIGLLQAGIPIRSWVWAESDTDGMLMGIVPVTETTGRWIDLGRWEKRHHPLRFPGLLKTDKSPRKRRDKRE